MKYLILGCSLLLGTGAWAQVRNLAPAMAAEQRQQVEQFQRFMQTPRDWHTEHFEAEQERRWVDEDGRALRVEPLRPLGGDE